MYYNTLAPSLFIPPPTHSSPAPPPPHSLSPGKGQIGDLTSHGGAHLHNRGNAPSPGPQTDHEEM